MCVFLRECLCILVLLCPVEPVQVASVRAIPRAVQLCLEALTVWWDSTCPLCTILAAWMSEQLQSSHGLHELYSRQIKGWWFTLKYSAVSCGGSGCALQQGCVCSAGGLGAGGIWAWQSQMSEPSGFTSSILVVESFIPQWLWILDCAVALKRSRCSAPFSSSFSITSRPSLAVECLFLLLLCQWCEANLIHLLNFAGHLGNADMIQPGLIPLQPNFDFMDTFEPFQGKNHI